MVSMNWLLDGMGWYGMVLDGMVWYGMVWDGMGWYGMVWDGMGWYGMAWDGMGWYGMVWDTPCAGRPAPPRAAPCRPCWGCVWEAIKSPSPPFCPEYPPKTCPSQPFLPFFWIPAMMSMLTL